MGTREPRKNLDTIRHAFQLARQQSLKSSLVIAGRLGWMQQADAKFSHTHFPGFISDEDLPALYRHAQAFLAPSIYEGFDLPPLRHGLAAPR